MLHTLHEPFYFFTPPRIAMKKMNWNALLSTQRFKIDSQQNIISQSPGTYNPARTEFHIDHDRVVFSTAFRRLGRKTQVHPFAEHDHTHNRLTHSVEVASVGRSLGNTVGEHLAEQHHLPANILPVDIGTIVQVACLAHDLGNPPFGHAGENALRDWFTQPENQRWLSTLTAAQKADLMTYEGNAHSLRTVATLEMHVNRGGMRLTAASIGSLIKYPWDSNLAVAHKGKFNLYQTELALFQAIAEDLGLLRHGDSHWSRHPLSYLMEAADDICYALLDLEDAQEIGMIATGDITNILQTLLPGDKSARLAHETNRQYLARLRSLTIGKIIHDLVQTFAEHEEALLDGSFAEQFHDLIGAADPAVRVCITEAKRFAREKIYPARSKLLAEIAAYPCLGSLLTLLIPAAHAAASGGAVDERQQLALRLLEEDTTISAEDSVYSACMKVLDYIGSLTDNAAVKIAREVSGILPH